MVRFSSAGILSLLFFTAFLAGTFLFMVGLAIGFAFEVFIDACLRNCTLFSLESLEAGCDLERGLGARGFLPCFLAAASSSGKSSAVGTWGVWGELGRLGRLLPFLGCACAADWRR